MPTAALSLCATCGQRGCTQHRRPPWASSTSSQRTVRIRGHKLQRLRQRLFQEHPLCVTCLDKGRYTEATIRDHIMPLAEHGQDVEDNVQPLCQECSDIKTKEEAKRGKSRNY